MTTNSEDNELNDQTEDFDAADEYLECITNDIGLKLRKRPSPKQKSEIIKEIKKKRQEREVEIDICAIFENYARDCYEPLYFTDKKMFARVENILSSFLHKNHPSYEGLHLNDLEPPLCISQLIKKPTIEQVTEVIKAFREHDKGFIWYESDGDFSGPIALALTLGSNYPELIKNNAQSKRFFNINSGSDNPQISKNKKFNILAKSSLLLLLLIAILLVFIFFYY